MVTAEVDHLAQEIVVRQEDEKEHSLQESHHLQEHSIDQHLTELLLTEHQEQRDQPCLIVEEDHWVRETQDQEESAQGVTKVERQEVLETLWVDMM